MNERIKELADQILPNEKEFRWGDPRDWGYFFSGEELEKFAELIVKECCDVLHDNEMGGYQVNYVLKEHFGIE